MILLLFPQVLHGAASTIYNRTSIFAFSRLLFIPQSLVPTVGNYSKKFTCFDLDYLIEQNKVLQSTCKGTD